MIHPYKLKSNPAEIIPAVILCALSVIICLNPFKDILNLTEICFYIALIFAFVMFFIRRNKFDLSEPLRLPFLLFVLWAIASIAWAVEWKNTLHDLYPRLIKFIILYYLLILVVNTRRHFIYLVYILIASTSLFALGSLLYVYCIQVNSLLFQLTLDHISANHIGEICLFAALLSVIALSFAEKWPQRIALVLCFSSNLIAILLTYSRSSLLALAIGTCVLIYFSKFKKTFAVAFSIILVSVIFLANTDSMFKAKLSSTAIFQEARIAIFATALEMIKDRPLNGFGFDAKVFGNNMVKYNQRLSPKYSFPQIGHTHNVFLDITIRLGLIGLGLFLFILFRVFKMARELINAGEDAFIHKWGAGLTACLVAILVAGLFENILAKRISMILYITIAMITILWKLHRLETHNSL